MNMILDTISKFDLIFAFLFVGIVMMVSFFISKHLTQNKIPAIAIAITVGLGLALLGNKKGIADITLFSGLSFFGGSMLRDFSIVSTAMGASVSEIRKGGITGLISLFIGVLAAFSFGTGVAYLFGYTDPKSAATIGAGACTFIVGPVTGSALGAPSDVIALSIAIGVIKTVVVTILTPIIARNIGLNNPQTAMIYGGLIGTTSGVSAGLAATDPKLVPYGALTATFYTGLGCLLCPSVLYFLFSHLM